MTIQQRIILLGMLILTPLFLEAGEPPQRFAIATIATPVLNTPQFGQLFGGPNGNRLKTDRCGQLRELEFIALPGTVFLIEDEIPFPLTKIYRVTTKEYPYSTASGYFIDARFVRIVSDPPAQRTRNLPNRQGIIERLRAATGLRYVWGGNVSKGIPQMSEYYPPAAGVTLPEQTKSGWQLAGLDCSGLLYEATNGYTPRNSSSLTRFGEAVHIAGETAASIARRLEPLDLIVWPGHLLIVLDRNEVIESRLECNGKHDGVSITPLVMRLTEIMQKRKPADGLNSNRENETGFFVARRWVEPAMP